MSVVGVLVGEDVAVAVGEGDGVGEGAVVAVGEDVGEDVGDGVGRSVAVGGTINTRMRSPRFVRLLGLIAQIPHDISNTSLRVPFWVSLNSPFMRFIESIRFVLIYFILLK